MKFVELAKSLKEGVAPVYLVEGEESYFRDHAVESIRAACHIANPALNDVRYEGDALKGDLPSLVRALEPSLSSSTRAKRRAPPTLEKRRA